MATVTPTVRRTGYVTFAGVLLVLGLLFIGAQPGWAIAAIVVDGLVIAALTAGFDEFSE